jgi:hypothetical protein
MPSTCPISQWTKPILLDWTSTSPGATPVAPPRRCWTHSTPPFTQTRSPWPAAPRPILPHRRQPLEARCCSHPEPDLAADDLQETLARWAHPPLLCEPSDLDPSVGNRSLNRTVTGQSGPLKHHKILRLSIVIRPKGYQPIRTEHVAFSESNRNSNRSLKPDLIQIFGNSYLLICRSKKYK